MSDRQPSTPLRRSPSSGAFRSIRHGAVAWLMAAAAPAWSADAPAPDCLYRPFEIPAGDAWGPNQIELTGTDWRSGQPRGARVGEAAMKQHLAKVGRLFIGGICVGARDGDTYRACGFALAEAVLGGRRYDDPRWRWPSTTGTALVSETDTGSAVVNAAFSVPDPVLPEGAPVDFVGMQAPPALLKALRGAYGTTLSFGFRALLNPLAEAATSAPGRGLVVLCAGRDGSAAESQTATR